MSGGRVVFVRSCAQCPEVGVQAFANHIGGCKSQAVRGPGTFHATNACIVRSLCNRAEHLVLAHSHRCLHEVPHGLVRFEPSDRPQPMQGPSYLFAGNPPELNTIFIPCRSALGIGIRTLVASFQRICAHYPDQTAAACIFCPIPLSPWMAHIPKGLVSSGLAIDRPLMSLGLLSTYRKSSIYTALHDTPSCRLRPAWGCKYTC